VSVHLFFHDCTLTHHCFRLSRDAYNLYMMAVAEKQVCDALKARDAQLGAGPAQTGKVELTLMNFFAPETCPGCACAFEHAGSCAAMYCENCKQHFCLYCKKIFKAEGSNSKKPDISTIAHNHVFECEKKPSKESILTDSVLFPVGSGPSDGRFLDAFFKIRRLEMLEFQLQQGKCTPCMSCWFFYLKSIFSHSDWTSEECRRLVMDKDFQDVLKSIKERQTYYRGVCPAKPTLLKFAFHKVRVCIAAGKCTLIITQVIGIDPDFDFDVSTFNPPWMNNLEDGVLKVRPKRQVLNDNPVRWPTPMECYLVELGFTLEVARHAIEACGGDVFLAVNMLVNNN